MSRRERVLLVCDLCGRDDDTAEGIATRRVLIDRIDVEAEVCTDCWTVAVAALVPLSKVGRRPLDKVRKRRAAAPQPAGPVFAWPDTDWHFSSHAIVRIGERHLDPEVVVEIAEHPEVSRPARLPEALVHEGRGIKVVVIPDRRIIVTAASKHAPHLDDEVDAYAAGQVVPIAGSRKRRAAGS